MTSGYQGNGTFQFTYNWVNDANNAIPITASRMDTQFGDATSGFDNVICRDGQSTTTASVPFAYGITTNTIAPNTGGGAVTVAGLAIQNGSLPTSNWAPTDQSGAGLTFTVNRATYSTIGLWVFCDLTMEFPTTSDASLNVIGGLPFSSAAVTGVGGAFWVYDGSSVLQGQLSASSTNFSLYNVLGQQLANSTLSGLTIRTQFMLPRV